MTGYDIEIYFTEDGKEPFSEWLESLKDRNLKRTLLLRIQRLRAGNFGDFKPFKGLIELRVHLGPGYRIYCGKIGDQLILLRGGGDKSSQANDIKKCILYLEDYKRRF